jgi:hypothetical protein
LLEEIKAAWAVYCIAFQRWWDLAVEMMLLNIVVVLVSMTVVLAPLALFGMFYCTSVMVYGEDYGIGRTFSLVYEGAKKYWRAAWIWFVANALILLVMLVNIMYYEKIDAFWAVLLRSFFIVMLVLWLMIQIYAVAYFFEQHQKSVRVALKNGFLTLFAAPIFSLMVCGGIMLLAVLFSGLFVPVFLGGMPLLSFISNAAVINRIKKYKLRK